MNIVCDTQINELVHNRVYVYKLFSLYNGFLEILHVNNNTFFVLSIYGQKKLL